jgi:ankyrin repeat protein
VCGFAEPLPPDLLITLIEYLPLSVISRKDEKGWTVLHYYVRYVQPFKEEGYQRHLDEMDTNDALMEDPTPLIDEDNYAFSGGSSFVGYNLVEEEDDDSIMDSEMSPSVSIPRYHQYSVVRALLKKFPEATRMLNDEGHTPLMIARPLDCLQALSEVEHRASSPSLLGM